MTRQSVILRAVTVLLVVWLAVWAIRAFAGSRKLTAERLQEEIEAADFADWSERGSMPDNDEARQRAKRIERIADMVNRLDFKEREKNRGQRGGEMFFRKLSAAEKSRFIDLTVMESMNRFMESLDAMPPEQRKQFVEKGLKAVENGRTEADMNRAEELDPELLDKITREGMRAYFEKSNAETKLDLAPLMDAINETMQGLRGHEFGPRNRS